jgi:hypothetical protein
MRAPVLTYLDKSGYLADLLEYEEHDNVVRGTIPMSAIKDLELDDRFLSGGLHGLHDEVGKNRVDFRSITGKLGEHSLQIVIGDKRVRNFYADIDGHNPYQDVVGFVGHAGTVIKNWFKRLWR